MQSLKRNEIALVLPEGYCINYGYVVKGKYWNAIWENDKKSSLRWG